MNFYTRSGVANSSGIMSNNIRNLVGSHGSLSDFKKFKSGIVFADLVKDDSSLDVKEESIGLLGFGDSKNIYKITQKKRNYPSIQ